MHPYTANRNPLATATHHETTPAPAVADRPPGGQPAPWVPRAVSVLPKMSVFPTSPKLARMHALTVLRDWDLWHHADLAELIVSELVTNVEQVAYDREGNRRDWSVPLPIFELRLLGSPEGLRMVVWDDAPGFPVPAHADVTAESGRGLEMVSALAATWGWSWADGPAGAKFTWADLVTGAGR
jgi:hypothetical protein